MSQSATELKNEIPLGGARLPDLSTAQRRYRKRPGRLVLAIVVLFLLVFFGVSFARNPRFEWGVVGDYIFSPPILKGALVTLELSAIALVLGFVFGIIIAMMRLSKNPVLSWLAVGYVWVVRSIPPLVQILFIFNLGALFPSIGIGVPWGPTFATLNYNGLIGTFTSAIIALSLVEAAYMSEIMRAGFSAPGMGQREAAQAVGMNASAVMRYVIFPQAVRVIIPPMGNQIVHMLKTTTLVSLIGISDLLYTAESIYQVNYKPIPLLLVASFWYLVMTSVLTGLQMWLEARREKK